MFYFYPNSRLILCLSNSVHKSVIILTHIDICTTNLGATLYVYSEASPIQTHVCEPIIIVYIEIDSLIRKFSYPDSQLWEWRCPDKWDSTVHFGDLKNKEVKLKCWQLVRGNQGPICAIQLPILTQTLQSMVL